MVWQEHCVRKHFISCESSVHCRRWQPCYYVTDSSTVRSPLFVVLYRLAGKNTDHCMLWYTRNIFVLCTLKKTSDDISGECTRPHCLLFIGLDYETRRQHWKSFLSKTRHNTQTKSHDFSTGYRAWDCGKGVSTEATTSLEYLRNIVQPVGTVCLCADVEACFRLWNVE